MSSFRWCQHNDELSRKSYNEVTLYAREYFHYTNARAAFCSKEMTIHPTSSLFLYIKKQV